MVGIDKLYYFLLVFLELEGEDVVELSYIDLFALLIDIFIKGVYGGQTGRNSNLEHDLRILLMRLLHLQKGHFFCNPIILRLHLE